MSIRMQQTDVNEMLAAVEKLVEGGFQCGEETFEVMLSDLEQLKIVARRMQSNLLVRNVSQQTQNRKR